MAVCVCVCVCVCVSVFVVYAFQMVRKVTAENDTEFPLEHSDDDKLSGLRTIQFSIHTCTYLLVHTKTLFIHAHKKTRSYTLHACSTTRVAKLATNHSTGIATVPKAAAATAPAPVVSLGFSFTKKTPISSNAPKRDSSSALVPKVGAVC